MATRTHPRVLYAFATRTTDLATNTTLASATEHTFSAITAYIPESSPTFKSVYLEITVRMNGTAAVNLDGWRVGVQLGAVAWDDQDYVPTTITATGEAYTIRIRRDVTSYFQTNWTGTSMSVGARVRFETNVASNMNHVTCKLVFGAYTYDDSTGTTGVKTVAIPIQSHHTTLTTTKTEIGTGGTNGAAANQIPALDTFLPEASKTYRNAFIAIDAHDATQNSTDFNLFTEIDSAGESTRGTIESGLQTRGWYHDVIDYPTGTHSTASAHSFNARSSLTGRFSCLGAVMYVTYEYNRSTSTSFIQSLEIPIGVDELGPYAGGSIEADQDRFQIELWVEEPTTIALVQSGIMFRVGYGDSSMDPVLIGAGSQTNRTYTPPGTNASCHHPIVHRTDHGSGWTLVRGKNTLSVDFYSNAGAGAGLQGAVAIINYTSGKASGGDHVHNGTSLWHMFDFPTTGSTQQILVATGAKTPEIGADYWVNAYGIELDEITGAASTVDRRTPYVIMEVQTGEFGGDGWRGFCRRTERDSEYQTTIQTFDLLPWHNRDSNRSGKMDVETQRDYRYGAVNNGNNYLQAISYLTHHEITFSAAGDVSGYAGSGGSLTVYIMDLDEGEVVATATTAVGGAYSATLFDDTQTYQATCREDATHVGASDHSTPT